MNWYEAPYCKRARDVLYNGALRAKRWGIAERAMYPGCVCVCVGGVFSVSALEFEHEQTKRKWYKCQYSACIALQRKRSYLAPPSAQPPSVLRRCHCHGNKRFLRRLLWFCIPPEWGGGCSKLSTETQYSVHVGRGRVGVRARLRGWGGRFRWWDWGEGVQRLIKSPQLHVSLRANASLASLCFSLAWLLFSANIWALFSAAAAAARFREHGGILRVS
jgi:hypothetical protein